MRKTNVWKAAERLVRACKDDPDPVSMFTEIERNTHTTSVVVLRGHDVIESFRQWAERNGIYTRGNGVDGQPRTEDLD